MRILLISIALLAGVVAGFATAGVPETPAEVRQESSSVLALRALVSRCLPSVGSDQPLVTTGLSRLDTSEEMAVLGARQGQVFLDRREKVLLIAFDDVPVCRVVALSIDPAVLADLVIKVFREGDGTFERKRFRLDADGGFAAVYTGTANALPVVVRISTTHQANGNVFASLNVERATALQN